MAWKRGLAPSLRGACPLFQARAERVAVGLLRLSAVATLAMVVLSWPLWLGGTDIPAVPFVPALARSPVLQGWPPFLALVTALAATAFGPRPKLGYVASLTVATLLVLQDQHRFQPWLYQYAVVAGLIAAMPTDEGLRYVRWWFVSLYLHSGLSKLDRSFRDELGPLFLDAAGRLLRVDTAGWPASWRTVAILAMPAFEVLVAVALLVPKGRALGLAGAWMIHLGLVAVLGPWALGHSPNVLVWNVAMAAEVGIAFGRKTPENTPQGDPRGIVSLATFAVRGAFWVGVLLPFGERWGVFDAWPSHALYASHIGRVTVDLHVSEIERYPESVRRYATPVGEDGLWLRLDLTAWSRSVRGTPVYPQDRACLGLAEGLAARYGGRGLVRAVVSSPADRFSGRRTRKTLVGLDAIIDEGTHYRLNTHPTPLPRP